MNRRIAKKKFKQYIDNIITANSGDIVIIRWGKDISVYDIKNIKLFSSYLRKIAIEKNIVILIAPPESDIDVIYKLENDLPINKVQYIFDRIISLYKEGNKDKIDSIYNQLNEPKKEEFTTFSLYNNDQHSTIPIFRCAKCYATVYNTQYTRCPSCNRIVKHC